MTAEEFDARVEFGWHVPDLKGILPARVQALLWSWRPRASHRHSCASAVSRDNVELVRWYVPSRAG